MFIQPSQQINGNEKNMNIGKVENNTAEITNIISHELLITFPFETNEKKEKIS